MQISSVNFEGHVILPGGEFTEGDAKGVYNYAITMSRSTGSASITSYRTGLILPRPGSTLAHVRNSLRTFCVSQIGGNPGDWATLYFDLAPNIVFGARGDITGTPDETDPTALAYGVNEYEEWERKEAARRNG